jgi:hypothetical protein
MTTPGDCGNDGIRSGSRFPEQRMIMRAIVDAAGDAAYFSVANKAGKRHANGTRITQIGEVVWSESPATTLLRHASENDLALGNRGLSRFHVENNARYFQQIKVEISRGFMALFENILRLQDFAALRRDWGGR